MNINNTFQGLIDLVIPLTVFLITIASGYILRKILFKKLIRLTQNTTFNIDNIIIESIKGPFIIWFIMLGIYLGLEVSKATEETEEIVNIAGKILFILGTFSVTIALTNIFTKIIKAYSGKIQTALPLTSLTQNIGRIVIFAIGLLVILNSLG
ncbi:MAG: hypothetical protein KKD66_26790, partial [Proteobacteria bacterium]|nr:hypothetical protein [Pseudomonadota bacterium]MBU1599464.1 hypothetical protein [bacterium]